MRTVLSTCPFCGCGCAIYLQAENGKPIGVAPSENHPVSQSRLCARGWGAHEAVAWGERLTRPMIRRNGTLEPASWDDALSAAADGLKRILAAGKRVGVLGSARATNEENFLAGKLARAGLGTNNLDFCLGAAHRALIQGVESVIGGCPQPASLADIEKSEVILLWEGDIARTHPRVAFSIMRAVKGGARLVTFGCVRTQMSHFAALHVAVAPGSEGDAINALIAAVLDAGLQDNAVVRERCEGFEGLRSAVASAKATDELRQAAEWYARAARAAVLMAPTSGQGERAMKDAAALTTLAAVTGHLGRPGSTLLPLMGRSNMRGACEMGVGPDILPGHSPVGDEEARTRFEAAWGRAIPSERGLTAEEMMDGVSGLIVVADDPPSILLSGKKALDAMSRMECVVVLDAFDTPAAQAGRVLLPIASFAESDGTYTSMEGRVQRVRPCTDPPGEARSGWQVVVALAGKLGLSMSYGSAADVLSEIARLIPSYAGMNYQAMDSGWGMITAASANGNKAALQAAVPAEQLSEEHPLVLAIDGAFDWGQDPMVSLAPTLSRDYVSRRKLFPGGVVEMSRTDADGIGVRQAWQVKFTSAHGDAVLPISIRTDLEPGVALVPYAFRDQAAAVLAGRRTTAVKAERA